MENAGGEANGLHIHYSDEDSWFKVIKGRRLYNYKPFPMEFSIPADNKTTAERQNVPGLD
ncbi:MAG: hypothetical protein R3E79_01085 [Caldilineaceae bacterium]